LPLECWEHSGATQKSISLPEGVYLKGIGNGIGTLQSLPLSFTTIARTTDHLVASISAPNAGVTPFVGLIARRRHFRRRSRKLRERAIQRGLATASPQCSGVSEVCRWCCVRSFKYPTHQSANQR
jgi:hypothetical protein